VAALTGVCSNATFDGQAPMALEAAAQRAVGSRTRLAGSGRRFAFKGGGQQNSKILGSHKEAIEPGTDNGIVVDPRPILRCVLNDISRGLSPDVTAARFHLNVARHLASAAAIIARANDTNVVALSGGAIQNTLLRNQLFRLLGRRGLRVCCNNLVPANDAGISLGQAVAAGRVAAPTKR